MTTDTEQLEREVHDMAEQLDRVGYHRLRGVGVLPEVLRAWESLYEQFLAAQNMPQADPRETLRRARDKALERAALGELVAAHLAEVAMWERKLRSLKKED